MTGTIISAIFDNASDAEHAVMSLRRAGFPDESIAVLQRDPGSEGRQGDGATEPDNKLSGALRGFGVGAGVGALFGLSALVIPGIGPFIAAGSLLEALGLLGSAAVSGAVVGGTAGGLAGALMKYGIRERDAAYYEECIEKGGIWVAVDTQFTIHDANSAARILHASGGTSMTRNERSDTIAAREPELDRAL